MKNFKEYITERLKLSQARKYMKISKGKYKTLLDHIFKGNDRLYYPLNIDTNEIKDSPLINKIVKHIEKKGYNIEKLDYLGGYILSKKNKLKIGKLIKDNEILYKAYMIDPIRDGVKRMSKNNLLAVISRHPYDVAGMSTNRHWRSCMGLQDDYNKEDRINARFIDNDIRYGTIIAYLITSNDKNIEHPLARILIKPYVHSTYQYNDDNTDIAYVPDDIYGAYNEQFKKFINHWVDTYINTERAGLYMHHNKLYNDNDVNKEDPEYPTILINDLSNDRYLNKYLSTPDKNGNIIIPHDLYWNNIQLKTLPFKDKKVIVQGEFFIYYCDLNSLEGSPYEVTEYFNCSGNNLSSLKGAPQKVGGGFSCADNLLTNLIGGPIYVGGDYICVGNPLTTLEGVPNHIKGDFNCSRCNLKNFIGGPKIVEGDYHAMNNPLESLQGLPQQIWGYLFLPDSVEDNPLFNEEYIRKNHKIGGKIVYY